jgi:hypothetical protein
LNSSVYLPRFPFLTCVSLRYYSSSLRDTFYAGKVSFLHHILYSMVAHGILRSFCISL